MEVKAKVGVERTARVKVRKRSQTWCKSDKVHVDDVRGNCEK